MACPHPRLVAHPPARVGTLVPWGWFGWFYHGWRWQGDSRHKTIGWVAGKRPTPGSLSLLPVFMLLWQTRFLFFHNSRREMAMPIIYQSNRENAVSRQRVKDYLAAHKHSGYRVMDIGGAAGPWCDEFVDVYVDKEDVPGKNVIIGDIQADETWARIREFHPDFIICTHVLEDLRDPLYVLKNINELCCSGYISMPNKHTELSNIESMLYVGYCHHRYIFSLHDGVLFAFFKFSMANMFSWYGRLAFGMQRLPFLGKKIASHSKSLDFLKKPVLHWHDSGLVGLAFELGILFEGGLEFCAIDGDYAYSGDRMYEIFTQELGRGL